MAGSSFRNCTLASYSAVGFQGVQRISLRLSIPLDMETDWTVSVLKHNWVFQHHSILFQSKICNDAFIVELTVNKDEANLEYRSIDLANYPDLSKQELGNVRKSANSILETAKVVLKRLGSYHQVLKNCQV